MKLTNLTSSGECGTVSDFSGYAVYTVCTMYCMSKLLNATNETITHWFTGSSVLAGSIYKTRLTACVQFSGCFISDIVFTVHPSDGLTVPVPRGLGGAGGWWCGAGDVGCNNKRMTTLFPRVRSDCVDKKRRGTEALRLSTASTERAGEGSEWRTDTSGCNHPQFNNKKHELGEKCLAIITAFN